MGSANNIPPADVAAAEAAQNQGQAGAQRRQDYYGARPGMGVPAGASPELAAFLAADPAVTGVDLLEDGAS